MRQSSQSNVEKLAGLILSGLGIYAIILIIRLALYLLTGGTPEDPTDSPSARSGMAFFIDHGTGCQYLGRPEGALTPRLGPDGKQICGAH